LVNFFFFFFFFFSSSSLGVEAGSLGVEPGSLGVAGDSHQCSHPGDLPSLSESDGSVQSLMASS
jgi:hypothetical protein